MDDSVYKSKYYLQAVKKKDKSDRLKTNLNETSKRNDKTYTHRNYSNLENKYKHMKKLHLNDELRKVYCYRSEGDQERIVRKI